MNGEYIDSQKLLGFSIWEKSVKKRIPFSFDLEITARCNNNCHHCYINLPANDNAAQKKELTLAEISSIADQAVDLGSIWCLISGGEPLIRRDFMDIYLLLKKKGLLISLFTNACLLTEKHIELFTKYPPRDFEVTVYGLSQKVYERVTQQPGSFAMFKRGLALLHESKLKVHYKTMALRSNLAELPRIADFCRERSWNYFRFDPLLHLRFDGDSSRNEEIKAERLLAEEIAQLEKNDPERFFAMKKNCDRLIISGCSDKTCRHLFHCGAGNKSFSVSYDGLFRLCSSLWSPECIYELRKGTLADAWFNFAPLVRQKTSTDEVFFEKCHRCPLINLCLWCPAHAHLETGRLDGWSEYFCQVAHARAEALQEAIQKEERADKDK